MLEGLFGKKKRRERLLTPEQAREASTILRAELETKYPHLREERERREQEEKDRRDDAMRWEATKEHLDRNADLKAIRELREPVEHIVEQLSEELEAGAYSVIIGDDASGRTPTIMIATIARRIAERNDARLPSVRFLAGSTGLLDGDEDVRDRKIQALNEQVAKIKDTIVRSGAEPGKVLIVTDTVASGESVNTLHHAIRQADWDADVASIGASDLQDLRQIQRFVSARIVFGKHDVPDIYHRKEVTGVTKQKGDIFAKPHPDADPQRVKSGRRVAKEIAEEVFKEYEDRRSA